MAEERTLGLARARETSSETWGEEPSKEELQRRMDEARDSITNTVTEIKENVAQQVENVKDALDWREHFKRQPLAWSLGAAGVGFFVGYGIAAAFTGDERDEIRYSASPAYSLSAQPVTREATNAERTKPNGKDDGPGLLERFRETSAYERLSQEAGAIGDRLVEELSATAQQVVLPALLKKIKTWIGLDLSNKTTSMGNQREVRTSSQPVVGSPS
ncbi:MAG TPA: hypothetical protein VE977_03335 [Pyrinomonadaceae bacterium]|nr:hypothetical protein [Pyrinomonadaceae bacterium]